MSHIDVMKQALEYLQDNQHLIADNERHAYVMEYNAFIERFEQAIADAEKPAPPECQTEAEKIAFAFGWYKALESVRKPWVGLTDEEMRALKQKMVEASMLGIVTDFEYIRSIEAKLKEKNSGVQPAREPLTEAAYYNACLSYRHDFGLMPDEDRQKLIFEAKEWARAFGITKGNT